MTQIKCLAHSSAAPVVGYYLQPGGAPSPRKLSLRGCPEDGSGGPCLTSVVLARGGCFGQWPDRLAASLRGWGWGPGRQPHEGESQA